MKSSIQSKLLLFRPWYNALNGPLTFLSVLVALAASYFALLDWKVGRMIKDPAFMNEIAQRVRPALVFNAEGSVISDSGALQFLEGTPKVELAKRDESLRVAKSPSIPRLRSRSPILESLDISNVSVTAKRGPGLTWKITVIARYEALATEAKPESEAPARFRVELSRH